MVALNRATHELLEQAVFLWPKIYKAKLAMCNAIKSGKETNPRVCYVANVTKNGTKTYSDAKWQWQQ